MSAGFTPGPWNVQSDGQIWCDDHPIVEKMCRGPWGDEATDFITGEHLLVHHWGTVAVDEAKANARLIAAAPELFEALSAYVADCTNDECEFCVKGKSALAKARGEA